MAVQCACEIMMEMEPEAQNEAVTELKKHMNTVMVALLDGANEIATNMDTPDVSHRIANSSQLIRTLLVDITKTSTSVQQLRSLVDEVTEIFKFTAEFSVKAEYIHFKLCYF